MAFYLDSSAWVSLGYVEAMAALSRRLPEKDLARIEPRLKTDWRNMVRLHITGELIERAVDLTRQYKLRGTDAVHLAATLQFREVLSEVNEAVVLVASDHEMLDAARAARLQVEDPALEVQSWDK